MDFFKILDCSSSLTPLLIFYAYSRGFFIHCQHFLLEIFKQIFMKMFFFYNCPNLFWLETRTHQMLVLYAARST